MVLQDGLGRVHDYLRISLVDRCNLRCTYCMPEHVRFLPMARLMQREEILAIARLFAEDYGLRRIRLTGGEPLLRKDAAGIIADLAGLGLDMAITTNAVYLDKHLQGLQAAGMRSLNISLDTLRRDRFRDITLRDEFERVWENIQLARAAGFRVKLNVVVKRGMNVDEILDFVALTEARDLHVRFIEFMPFDGNAWHWESVVGYRELLAAVEARYRVDKLVDKPQATTKAYRVRGFGGSFAFISTVTDAFCSSCNRIRLTAEGKLRNCLFSKDEVDLLGPWRAGEDIRPLIEGSIRAKHARLGGLPEFQNESELKDRLSGRAMVKIGG